MFSCQWCGKDLKPNQTRYCSKPCKSKWRTKHGPALRRDERMLNAGITGRGIFNSSGNT